SSLDRVQIDHRPQRKMSLMNRMLESEAARLQSSQSLKLAFKVLIRWSNLNKDPKFGRFCRDVLGVVAGKGAGACCNCEMIGMDGRGRVVQSSSVVGSLYLSKGNLSSLTVGKSFGSGNSSLAVRMP
nr:hypothetical protein [Tanacetum cinerariifolium]